MLLTTQYLDEADQLADRIAVIDHGKVIAEGSSGQLMASVGAGSLHVTATCARAAGRGRAGPRRLSSRCRSSRPLTRPRCPRDLRPRAGRPFPGRAVPQRHRRQQFALGQPSLDEAFLALTGHAAEETPEEDAA